MLDSDSRGRRRYRPPYSSTVGLAGHGKPEIVVTGLPEQRADDLLNGVAAHFVHADPPSPGERVPLVGPLVEIVRVAEPSAHLNVAVELYGGRSPRSSSCTPTIAATGRGTEVSAAAAVGSRSSDSGQKTA